LWEKDGAVDSDRLRAELIDGPSAGLAFCWELAWLPEELLDDCVFAKEDAEIESICSRFTPGVLINAVKLPSGYPIGQGFRIGDAWRMRDEFVRMAPTVEGLIAFLNRWGCWHSRTIVIPDEVLKARLNLRDDLVSPPERWLGKAPWFLGHMSRTPSYPYSVLRTEKCESAIRLATTIDFLNKVKFKKCARPDCNNPFEVKSEHGQEFCQQYCAHVVSQRRNRAEAKEARKSSKNSIRKEV
jgi:hypothetical protein